MRYWDGEKWTERFAPEIAPVTSGAVDAAASATVDPAAPLTVESVAPAVAPATPSAGARKNWLLRHKAVTAILVVLLIAVFSAVVNGGGTKSSSAGSSSDPVAASAADNAAATKAAAYKAASDKLDADKAAAEQAAADKAAADAAAAEQAAEKARKNPASYNTIGARDYALLVKDPDAHIGEKYVVYGYVTQFDSATGTDSFRASTGASRQPDWYDYDQNTVVTAANAADIANVVNDDLVTLYVEVMGALSYDTQIGGNTTVPNLKVHIIKVTGSTK